MIKRYQPTSDAPLQPDAIPIAGRLRELAANPDLRARLGEAVRESALRFGWERMVAKHDQLFARLGS
jgi:glycosyltransferase involved in cell wall biosynthesis